MNDPRLGQGRLRGLSRAGQHNSSSSVDHRLFGALTVLLSLGMATCAGFGDVASDRDEKERVGTAPAGGALQTPVGLALEVENGVGEPLKVRAGQTFYIDQIDLRASLTAALDEGVAGLAEQGDFASLNWHGIALEEEGPPLANGDGTFTRRRF